MADDVQSPAGDQGAETTDSGLYDLDSVAPELRDQFVPHLKAIEGNVTKKFQEAAEYKKQWQPYEELGLSDIKPEELQGLLEFAKNANDPEWFANWWKTAGTEQGLFEQAAPETDDLGLEDDLSPEKVQELIEKGVAERLSPIEKTLQEQEQARRVEQANEEITAAFSKIEADNASLFEGKSAEEKEQVQEAINRLAYSYSDDSSLSVEEMLTKGLEDYKSFIGQGEKGLFEKKAEQPQAPEGPGAASTSPDKIASFDDPRLKAAGLERLKQSHSA